MTRWAGGHTRVPMGPGFKCSPSSIPRTGWSPSATTAARSYDLDAEYHTALGPRHDLVAGGGYRSIVENIAGGNGYSYSPNHANDVVINAFAQDEFSLAGPFTFTLGAKYEHDTFAGSGFQPTARAIWHIAPQHHAWAAVSRALRTPSLVDRGFGVDFPPAAQPDGSLLVLNSRGTPSLNNERVLSTEIGYRVEAASVASIDITGFFARYNDLITAEPNAPTIGMTNGVPVVTVQSQFQNGLGADTAGVEVSARVKVTHAWQLDGAISTFHLTPHASTPGQEAVASGYDGNAPHYQWHLHSAMSLGPRVQADATIFYVSGLESSQTPAYTRADARLEWKVTPQLSAVVRGQNLFNASHAEFLANDTTLMSTLVPRSAGVQLVWRRR